MTEYEEELRLAMARIAGLGKGLDTIRMSDKELIDYARRIAKAALA